MMKAKGRSLDPFDPLAEHCCPDCFADEMIRDFVSRESTGRGTCSFCGARRARLAELSEVAAYILAGVRREYESVDDVAIPQEMADFETFDAVLEEEGVFSERLTRSVALVDALFGALRSTRPGDPDETSHLRESGYISSDWSYDGDGGAYANAWQWFKQVVKHERRFFDPPPNSNPRERSQPTRAEMLRELAELLPELAVTLPQGEPLQRARVVVKDFTLPAEPLAALAQAGPPPSRVAGHQRMSPAGISYTYLASKTETCLAEVRPDVGARVLIASFRTRRPLRVVDLNAVVPSPKTSIFDPTYKSYRRRAADFLKEFGGEISRPIHPSESALEYVPTQVLAEFIRHSGYDGIRFRSSQETSGTNYVLFCGPVAEDSGDMGFADWLQLESAALEAVSSVGYVTTSQAPTIAFQASDFHWERPEPGF